MKALMAVSALGISLLATTTLQAGDVMVVYDASGSMWGQIDGVPKIEIAREAMSDLLATWPASTNLGLVAYGHREKGLCSDIETAMPVGPVDRDAFQQVVNGIMPLGRTPLSAAVQHAAEELSWRDAPATVVLISDGVENCDADPCALSEQLARQGVAFTTHVIGFDLATDEHQHLACIAKNTGGMFLPAQDAAQLAAAVKQVGETIAKPAPEPEPLPEAEAELPAMSISAPETAMAGSSFGVTWSDPVHPRDWVTIVPVGADEGTYTAFHRVGSDGGRDIVAPAEPGLYEVRYVLNDGDVTLARAPIEVMAAEASISAPETAMAGSSFGVTWSDPVHPRDWVTIVPVGADEGTYTVFHRVGSDDGRDLVAPADPGLYEVRYVLNEGGVTLARAPIEVMAAEASISAPETAMAGSSFGVTWSDPVHPRDWVTIVPVGADEGTYTVFHRVGSDDGRDIVAPADPGLYEVRYVLNEGGVTLARAPIEVMAAEASISAPETAMAGSSFGVTWSDPVHPRDWVTIVPVGADEGTYTAFHRVGSDDGRDIVAPADPGLYEVRYVLNEGGVTLARAPIEITGAEASITGPERVRAGNTLRFSWSDPVHPRDWVTIVPVGADEGAYTIFHRVGADTQRDITAPDEPGLYELRYVLDEGGVTLGRHAVEVVEATASLDEGAGLSAPRAAAPGETVTVTWTGGSDGADQRIALAREDQALFAWISAQPIDPEGALTFVMPEQPGRYEFRYLDISGQAVLGRAIIDVE
ncbi:Ca-activated chloride channel homolog (plasmid) [Nitratireductor aquimarinus]